MQKIPSGPFAKPRSTITDNNTNQNNCNSNHNILTQQNNLQQPTNGQSMYHQYRHHHHHHHLASYNNYRPAAIPVGGPCSTGIDQVDNSNSSSMDALTPNSLVDMQIPSETSETSSSSEPSSSSEEWESGECCENNPISSSNVSESNSRKNSDEMQAINNNPLDVKCGVKFTSNFPCKNSKNVVKSDDDHALIHLDYLHDAETKTEKTHETRKTHYNDDDNYYLGSSVSLVASAIPISCPNSDQLTQSLTSASPPTKILSQRKKFKAKSTVIHANTASNNVKKIRWLANMKSDPDFRETLNKNVHFRTGTGLSPVQTSNDSLNSTDYYSSICDKQLSFGSPAKSPGEFARINKLREHSKTHECQDIVIATTKKPSIIPEFGTPPPPNTPTTPTGAVPISIDDSARKSPVKTDVTTFKQRFFNFTRQPPREHDTGEIPIIKINDDADNDNSTQNNTKASSKFSFRDLRNEIQSAIKMHHQQSHATSSSKDNDNNKSNSDKKLK